jgi:hypothetical protein
VIPAPCCGCNWNRAGICSTKLNFVEREAIAMAKTSAGKPAVRGGKPAAGALRKGRAWRMKVVQRDVKSGQFVVSKARFEAVMLAAERVCAGECRARG